MNEFLFELLSPSASRQPTAPRSVRAQVDGLLAHIGLETVAPVITANAAQAVARVIGVDRLRANTKVSAMPCWMRSSSAIQPSPPTPDAWPMPLRVPVHGSAHRPAMEPSAMHFRPQSALPSVFPIAR